MNFANLSRVGLVAVAMTIGTISAAFAANAVATGAVNVRTGPSTSYAKVDTLHSGEQVDVRQCQSGWCYVEHSGPDGWVSANYLAQSNGYSGGGSSSSGNSGPNVNFSFSFGGNGPGITIGNPPVGPASRVCFYDGPNYTGGSICWNSGQQVAQMGPWNDRVTSVRTWGGASVQLCQHYNYNGYCRVVSNNGNLGGFLNNKVSSFKVY